MKRDRSDEEQEPDDGPRWAHALIGVVVGAFGGCSITGGQMMSDLEAGIIVTTTLLGAVGGYFLRGRFWRKLGL